jgi:hypothetical protein
MRSPLASAEPTAPCAKCLTRVPGLTWGDLCPDCQAELRRRASPIARRISLLAALLVILYAWVTITLGPTNRIWVAGIAVGAYFLVRRIATQITMEYLRGKFTT